MRGVSRGGGAVCREINKLQRGRKTRRFQFGLKVRRRGDESAFSMKTLSPPASPKHRTVRRVSTRPSSVSFKHFVGKSESEMLFRVDVLMFYISV